MGGPAIPSDLCEKAREDLQFRLDWAELCGIGFKLLEFDLLIIPTVPKNEGIRKLILRLSYNHMCEICGRVW